MSGSICFKQPHIALESVQGTNDSFGPGHEYCRQLCLTPCGSWFIRLLNEPFYNEHIEELDLRNRDIPLTDEKGTEVMSTFLAAGAF